MTIDEFKSMAKTITLAYPRASVIPNAEALKVWYGFLKHMDKDILDKVLEAWILNSQQPPSIADLNNGYIKLKNAENPIKPAVNRFDCIPPEERQVLIERGIIDYDTEVLNLMDAEEMDLDILEKYHFVRR